MCPVAILERHKKTNSPLQVGCMWGRLRDLRSFLKMEVIPFCTFANKTKLCEFVTIPGAGPSFVHYTLDKSVMTVVEKTGETFVQLLYKARSREAPRNV